MPDTSPWAERYQCEARERSQVVDTQPGWIYDTGRAGYPVWGREAAPGTANVYQYPACAEDRVVADVVRLDKGHTEGLEPEVTQRILDFRAVLSLRAVISLRAVSLLKARLSRCRQIG